MPAVVHDLSAKLNGSEKDGRKEGVCCSFTQKLSWGGFRAEEDLVLSLFKFGT